MLILSAALSGIQLGLVFGLLAFAIVLLFRSTGVPNFAQGAMATLGPFIVLKVFLDTGWSLLPALVASTLVSAVVGLAVYHLVMRPRSAGAGPLSPMIRTVGLALFLTAFIDAVWGAGAPFRFPPVVRGSAFQIGDVSITNQSLATLVLAVVVVAGSAVTFRYTDLGLTFRAASEKPETARLLGLPIVVLASWSWALAGIVSLLIGSLVASTALLSADMMASYLLFAFVGAVLGGMDSLVGALVGGIIIGIIVNVVVVTLSPDWAALVTFAVLLGILAVRPHGLFGHASVSRL